MKFATKAIHVGQKPEGAHGSVITPIYQTTTFAQTAPAELIGETGYDYSRAGNPTRTVLEDVLASLESGAKAYAFSSGMAALTTLVMALLNPGDEVIVTDDVYGGTFRLFDKVMNRFDIRAVYVDMDNADDLKAAVNDKTKMIFIETPTNPLLKLVDLEAVIKVAKDHNLISVVDNTFASPYLQQPFEFGADIILHSTTKYINGHSDVTGGALILRDETYADDIYFHQKSIGATPEPFAAWLTLRGTKTLAVRMENHVRSAQALAEFLEAHDEVEEVIYPGLRSHPQYEIAAKQMKGPGGMISMRIKGGEQEVRNFLKHLEFFTLAESLGGIESLIEIPALMTHASIEPEVREKIGITDNLIRISVGIENLDDLRNDLDQALKKKHENIQKVA
ncbi:MAG: cystathionine gamma-synthase [Pseudomonadota bacterium]